MLQRCSVGYMRLGYTMALFCLVQSSTPSMILVCFSGDTRLPSLQNSSRFRLADGLRVVANHPRHGAWAIPIGKTSPHGPSAVLANVETSSFFLSRQRLLEENQRLRKALKVARKGEERLEQCENDLAKRKVRRTALLQALVPNSCV